MKRRIVNRGVLAGILVLALLAATVVGVVSHRLGTTRPEVAEEGRADIASLLARSVRMETPSARPYLGITYQELETQELNDSDASAIARAVVAHVVPGSPAAMGGLRTGDIILSVNGEALSRESPLLKVLLKKLPGDEVKLLVQRGHEHLSLEVVLGKQ